MGTLSMSVQERLRAETFSRVKRGELSVAKAAGLVGVSLRQGRRLWKSFQEEGDAGLVHGLRGRTGVAANRASEQRESAVATYREHYGGFGAALAAEYLSAEHGVGVGRVTLWRWLKEAKLGGRTRRAAQHRCRRERRPCVGELVQMDGSTHDWFEGRRAQGGGAAGPCVLFVMIDDATGRVHMRFYESEDTASAFDLFGRYVKEHGLPVSLYVDKDSIYRVNDGLAREKARQSGRKLLTQFGRAMKALGVGVIFADSPQAKGRVERMHGTQQDRLIKAMRLAKISDVASANRFLDQKYLGAFNAKFAHEAAEKTDVHRPVPRGADLADVLCVREERVVGLDWCVSYAGRVLQIDKRHQGLSLARRKVVVIEHADGTLKVVYAEKALRWAEVWARPAPAPPPGRTLADRTPWRPGPNHPWRSPAVKPAAAAARAAPSPAPRRT
jgi:transposase